MGTKEREGERDEIEKEEAKQKRDGKRREKAGEKLIDTDWK